MKKCFTFLIVVAMLLSFSACDMELGSYQSDAKAVIQTYADDRQDSYSAENWQRVCTLVEYYKKSVDEAKNRFKVDRAIDDAAELINAVAKFLPGAEEYAGGSGTESDPYMIGNRGQLIYFCNQINEDTNTDAHFALSADIDLDGMEWIPIGAYESFKGVFDGKGYEISHFNIHSADYQDAGLFGSVRGSILNLGTTNFEIQVSGYTLNAGGLAAYLHGDGITNCYAIGNVEAVSTEKRARTSSDASLFVGGLVGHNVKGTIQNCFAACEVAAIKEEMTAKLYVSSFAVNASPKSCFATGDVMVSDEPITVGYIGNSYSDSDCPCFSYEGQRIYDGSQGRLGKILDRPSYLCTCTTADLNDEAFYTENLGWSTDVWNFENLDFTDGRFRDNHYPKLKRI